MIDPTDAQKLAAWPIVGSLSEPTLLEAAEIMTNGPLHFLEREDPCPWCGEGSQHDPTCRYSILNAAIAREKAKGDQPDCSSCRWRQLASESSPDAKPTLAPVRDYGEPWYLTPSGEPLTRNHECIIDRGYGLRSMNCTTALRGCRPERLGELLNVLHEYLDGHEIFTRDDLRAALATFNPGATK